MKSLKLDHNIALLALNGQKTSTWRINDDKDLSVNDKVELIDKVDHDNPRTWQIIGVATIDQIVTKRLGEVSDLDTKGHESFTSEQQMYETFRRYYGPSIGPRSIVKIIHFTFKAYPKPKLLSPGDHRAELETIRLFVDGGSRGNPGPSAAGFVIFDKKGKIVKKQSSYLGITTNNQAEYQALKAGLESALEIGAQKVLVHMDSLLVVNQMKGLFKVRNRDLWPIHESAKQLAALFKNVTFSHIPRELNHEADAMVNEELDKAKT